MCSQHCEKKFQNMHVFWFVHSIAIKRPKLAWRFLMCSQGCEIKTETWVTVFNVFTTLWKNDPSLHHRFWCVHNMINRKLHDGFWCVRDILKNRWKLGSFFFMCWEHCEKKTESCITVFHVLRTFWEKIQIFITYFRLVNNIVKKTETCIILFYLFTTLREKNSETCILDLDVFKTFWKKTKTCIRVFNVLTKFGKRPKLALLFLRCLQNCEKREKLASRFLVCSQPLEKRPNFLSGFLIFSLHCEKLARLHVSWFIYLKKDWNLHHGFSCVCNTIKKIPKLALGFWMCPQLWIGG